MSKRTQKAGTSGRFGARYGVVVRNRVKAIEAHQKKNHECPKCFHMAVTRVSSGIWECRHCGYKFAAGAYTPQLKKTTAAVKGASAPVEEEAPAPAEE